jgi:hypothetical protein
VGWGVAMRRGSSHRFVCPQFMPAQSQASALVANANLQSITVQFTDKQGHHRGATVDLALCIFAIIMFA